MTVALIIAKGQSTRLKNKNWIDFGTRFPDGPKPMFQWNVEKCLTIFKKVYVSSDNEFILSRSVQIGASPIKRPIELCDDVANVPVYLHAYKEMMVKPDIIVAVQANSPTTKMWLIKEAKELMEKRNYEELITCHPDYSIYGSIWAMTAFRLEHYEEICGDFHHHKPDALLVDPSIDIHDYKDLLKANLNRNL